MRNNNRMQTKQNHPYRTWQRVVSALACTVMLITSYGGMILPVKATEQTAYCGHEEHQHSQECYEKRLICGHEETSGETHVHTAECYQQQRVLICGLEEAPGHIHDESCVQKSEGLTCGKEETPPHAHTESCVKVDKIQTCTDESEDHTHSDGCYQTKETYICGKTAGEGGHTHGPECYGTVEAYTCGKEAGEGGHTHGESCYETRDVLTCEIHVHTEACYEEVLVCDQEEHTHSLSCFSDPEADVESETVWENSVSGVELTGVWAEDVIAIAESQLGYTESERNYTVTGDGARKGYTRYGDWYGDPYGDWSAMFVSFCLYYAGISRQSVPYASDCAGWVGTLSGEAWGLYRNMEGNSPQKGDIVFLDTDADGSADHAGLVASVSGGSLQIIAGDSENRVQSVPCAMDSDRLLGFAALPENPNNQAARANDAALFALEGDSGVAPASEDGGLTITLGQTLNVDVVGKNTVKIPFTPEYTHEYIFQSTGTRDTYGYIYDANDNVLAADDDSGGSGQFKITYTLNAGVTYYLGVRWYSDSNSGTIPVLLTYGIHSYTKNESGQYVCGCGETAPVEGTCGDGVSWRFADGTLTISGSGAMQNYSYDNVPWQAMKKDITNVVVGDGVTSIGSYAFYGCSTLTSVTIPDSVTSIGSYAFSGCSALTSVTIPDSVTSIGNAAFYDCRSLTTVTIPDSVTSIGKAAFFGCSSLTSVKIPDSVTSIVDDTFGSCQSLISVTIPSSVTSIGNEAFRGCGSIKELTIPNSVTSIGSYAFQHCSSLTSVTIPDSVTSIGGRAFSCCSSLASVTISDGVTDIGYDAFESCSALTSVTIPKSVKTIGSNPFSGCSRLRELVWDAEDAALTDPSTSKVSNFALVIGENVDNIGAETFAALLKMGAKEIQFVGPNYLTLPDVQADVLGLPLCRLTAGDYYADEQGVLYRIHDGVASLAYCPPELTQYTVPAELPAEEEGGAPIPVTGVDSYAFAAAQELTAINFDAPEGITELRDFAFANACKLESINGADNETEVIATFPNAAAGVRLFENTRITYADNPTGEILNPTKEHVDLKISTATSANRTPAMAEDKTFQYYTGETATTSVTISNPDSSEIVDGTIVRIIYKFDRAGGTLNYKTGAYTLKATNSENEYQMTVSESTVPYCYVIDIERPRQGDTLSVNLGAAYPSPTSTGGNAMIWGGILTEEEAAAQGSALLPHTGGFHRINWSTQPDTFPVTKSVTSSGSAVMKGDGNGGAYISGLSYRIGMSRGEGQTLEGIGKDYITSVDFRDVLTLPEGAVLSAELIEAVRNKSYTTASNSSQVDYEINGTTFLTLGYPRYYYPESRSLEIDENGNLVLNWTMKNKDLSTEIPDMSFTYSIYGQYVLIPEPQQGTTYIVDNQVTATQHYMHSEDQVQSAECQVNVAISEGKLDFGKGLVNGSWSSGYFGDQNYRWRITASNPGVLPYERLAYIEDELPSGLWLTGDQLAALFAADTEHQLTVTISRATLCTPHTSQTVTGIAGTSTRSTSLRNTGTDTPYNGLASTDPDKQEEETIILGWGSDDNLLLTLGERELEIRTVDGAAIQAALDKLGFLVTANTTYKLSWDLRDENNNIVPLVGGGSIVKEIPCSVKDTFMLLNQDQKICYPNSSEIGTYNYAYAYDNNRKFLKSDYDFFYRRREFSLTKGWSWNGQAIEDGTPIEQGDVVNYSLTVQHSGTGSYDLLPLTDHMTGGQALLVPKAKNQNADWAAMCQTVTVEDAEFYLLTEPGTYSQVWTSDTQLADMVTVTKTASGFDTLMKWYFTDYTGSRTDTVSYQAYVCPNLAVPGAVSYSLGNESWLNDHATHRLYDVVGWWGTTIRFDKKIVESVGDTGAGTVHSYVHEGETVTYRLMLESGVDEEGNPVMLRLTGNDMYDTLPLSIDSYRWSKENVDISYQKETDDYQVVNGDSWYIDTASGSDQQLLKWDDNFSITFRGRAYIYVTLDFPQEIPWQNYAARYGGTTTLFNTYHVFNAQASVTHELSIPAQVRLQKGVYGTGYMYNDYRDSYVRYYNWMSDCRSYYNNDDVQRRFVEYYVSLYNGGTTNLYLTDMQDRLPRGFTLWGCNSYSTTGSSYAAVYRANGTMASLKQTSISSSTRTVGETQYVTFHFSNGTGSDTSKNIRYDESRRMYYLAPGEAIKFAYTCRTNQAADTDDAALNTISMPYYDYNGGGVQVDNDCKIVVDNSDKYTPNDGGCEVWDYGQAQGAGLTGGTTDTQWLTSQVTVLRGGIKPGITKVLTSKTDVNGNVTQNPASAAPTDTLNWTVTAENDGTLAITDYALTDVMQGPYGFTGKVKYKVFAMGRTEPVGGLGDGILFEIKPGKDKNTLIISYSVKLNTWFNTTRETELAIGNSISFPVLWTIAEAGRADDYRINADIQLSISRDDAGNAVMSIHFPKEMAIPEYGKGVLTLSTKNETGILENKQFVNAAFITPLTQTWDDGTNKGNMTTLTTPFADNELPSVRNSAPVTTTYGYMTSSSIRVTEVENPANTAASTDDPNFIVLENTEKLFNYTLSVENTTPKAMNELILISNLPQTGDHSSFLESDPRFSEFKVSLAEESNFTVTVTAKDGTVTTLDSNQYTIEFSDKTEYDASDWNGTSTWNPASADSTRSVRLKISDEAGTLIPEGSTVSLTFTCEIEGDADPGTAAWNSFGYHYRLKGESFDLEAAPLKVGVKTPSVPELKKRIVDHTGKEITVEKDTAFSFLVYQGAALTGDYDTEQALTAALDEQQIPWQKYTVTVPAGQSQSLPVRLAVEGWKWTADQTWTKGQQYTVTELPCGEKYEFSRFQGSTGTSYTFTYDPAQTQVITCDNTSQNWAVTLTKVNTDEEILSGAVFALYSLEEKDKISEIPEEYQELSIAQTLERDDKTWYLKAVGTTGEDGKLTFGDLLREAYYLVEVKPPVGYNISDTNGRLLEQKYESQGVYEITVVNRRGVELPKTGGIGINTYAMGGMLLIQCALISLMASYKRAPKKKERKQQ